MALVLQMTATLDSSVEGAGDIHATLLSPLPSLSASFLLFIDITRGSQRKIFWTRDFSSLSKTGETLQSWLDALSLYSRHGRRGEDAFAAAVLMLILFHFLSLTERGCTQELCFDLCAGAP